MDIKNKITGDIIKIDEDNIRLCPKMYDDVKKISFELDHFNWFDHTKKCLTCKNFLDSFGTDNKDWFIEEYGIIDFRILSNNNDSNKISNNIGEYFNGTKITLLFYS